jgi:hypothetical protein
MKQVTAADTLPELAAALGRFAQAAATLEFEVQTAIVRLLPITDKIGHVLFAGNSASRNREILVGLLDLPDVPLEASQRDKLKGLLSKIKQCQEDRNRLLHNRIVGGDGDRLIVFKNDKAGLSALDITVADISAWTNEIAEVAHSLTFFTPVLEYDLSSWVRQWPTAVRKPWPGR